MAERPGTHVVCVGRDPWSRQVDVPTPELGGESITEGTIAEWTAKVRGVGSGAPGVGELPGLSALVLAKATR